MTYRERFGEIKSKELRDKLLAATPADVLGNAVDGRSDSNLLRGAFVWGYTKEGHNYWGTLNEAVVSAGSFDAAWTKLYGIDISPSEWPVLPPSKTSTMVMERAGFKIPVTIRPSKPDPRGSEYGYFVVENTDNKYIVTKCDKHRNTEWSATFSEDSFLAWARDYT